ncbi:MAG: asparagine synthase (glutamine-hydrolyzing) [Gemmatimonadaceae bacterium]|nr:asparagine synthase (glutamine-hydrolyzing) [Gemmatimonadaceae bacterium]
MATGQQPMTNEDDAVWIVFNGEIYNHAELRPALERAGHRYRTRSDTETIIHQYEADGTRAPRKLRGMFAFAIWDRARQTLVLARDHTGIKPLYYAVLSSGDLVFGSEIKAIFASGLVPVEPDVDVLAEFFATGHVSGERTLFRGVRKLLPGTTLSWHAGAVRTERFWAIGETPAGVHRSDAALRGLTPAAAADEFWRRFTESVQSQLMADVPLGAFLSGGLDSSLLVAAMRDAGVETIRSFSVGYREAASSELPWARLVAKRLRTEHHEVIVEGRQFFDDLSTLSWHRDLPLAFSASIPLYHVSRLARSSVKVVLTGEGADELFAGYGRYPRALANRSGARVLDQLLPRGARSALARGLRGHDRTRFASRLSRSFLANDATVVGAFLEPFADYPADARRQLLTPAVPMQRPFGDLEALVEATQWRTDPLEALLRYDQQTYLEELLMKQDTMSMATSIESRVPFLDHHLVEWAAALPPQVKLAGLKGKLLVRLAAVGRLPAEVTQGPKRGFSVPLGEWLRTDGREAMESALPDRGDPWLDHAYARRLLDEHIAGIDRTARLWRLLAYQVWRREVVPRMASLARRSAPPPSLLSPR